jgi:type III pantothenate kinase
MLLAIDVGNTNTVFALHDGTAIVGEWRCRTERQRTADEYFVWLKELMEHAGLKPEVRSVVISSVVPQVVFNLRVLADRYFHTRPTGGGQARGEPRPVCRGSIRPPMSARTGW